MRWGTSLRGGRRELLLGYFFEPRGFRVGVPYWLKGRGLLWRGGSFSAAGPWAPNLKAEEGGWVGKGADGALKYGGEGGMLEDWGKVSIKGRRGGASSIWERKGWAGLQRTNPTTGKVRGEKTSSGGFLGGGGGGRLPRTQEGSADERTWRRRGRRCPPGRGLKKGTRSWLEKGGCGWQRPSSSDDRRRRLQRWNKGGKEVENDEGHGGRRRQLEEKEEGRRTQGGAEERTRKKEGGRDVEAPRRGQRRVKRRWGGGEEEAAVSMGSYEDRRGGPFEEPLTGRAGLANFHLGWFTKKKPPTSHQNTVFSLHLMTVFWGLQGAFFGDQPKWKISMLAGLW